MNCFMCGDAIGAEYVSRRGKKFCNNECSGDYAEMHPWKGNTNTAKRKGRQYNVR